MGGDGAGEGPNTALKRVLVVEDSSPQPRYLSMLLARHGYSVVPASNGREGLACVQRETFPLVITDWLMPEMDGLEFCRALRAIERDSYSYIILVTAQDTKDHIVKGLEAGADEYLVKPVHPAELFARLTTAMRILKLEAALREHARQIELLSNTDALTETFNRRYLGVRLGLEIKRCVRYGRPLSVAMCDLDHFKHVNDEHGHRTGDAVLAAFAQTIKRCVREQIDWVARYGGEEFVIVLPETGAEGAFAAAERYRVAVEQQVVPGPSGEPVRITASLGVASINPQSPQDPVPSADDDLLKRADARLYEAKRRGRNCTVGETEG